MRILAVWSALGGGAACAVVAGVAVERMGGIDTLYSTLQETVAPHSAHEVARTAPPAAAAPTKSASLESPAVSPDAAKPAESSGAPAFDVVRVEPGGDTVVAGHAAAHAAIELRDGAKVLGKTTADDSGQFVIVPDPLPAGEHALQLAARGATGAELTSTVATVKTEPAVSAAPARIAAKPSSLPTVATAGPGPVLAPSPNARPSAVAKASPGASLAAMPEPSPSASQVASLTAPPVVSKSAASLSAPAPAASPAPNQAPLAAPTEAPAPTQAEAPAPTRSVIPSPAPSGGAGNLKIVQAKPNDAGGLEASGAAAPGERVRLRLNGAFIAEVVANALGRWSLTVERGLTAGLYALRAEAVDASGSTGASTDATFAYAPKPGAAMPAETAVPSIAAATPAPAAVETSSAMTNTTVATFAGETIKPIAPSTPAVSANADPSHAVVAELRTATVIKGDNLWDLARHFYGDGLRYADIFHANSGLIHNPNLIYIGQVFVVPQDAQKTR